VLREHHGVVIPIGFRKSDDVFTLVGGRRLWVVKDSGPSKVVQFCRRIKFVMQFGGDL